MRVVAFLALLALPVLAFGQPEAALLGVNSQAGLVRAGARDVTISILVDPSPEGGDLLAVMAMTEGMRIRIQLPDGRSISTDTAGSRGFTWEVAPQGHAEALMM